MALSADNTIDTRERCERALLIVDMINALDFDGGARMLPAALKAAERIAELKHALRAASVPCIYANDNFGRWRSDFREVVERCLRSGVTGRPLAECLLPDRDDYFVVKPKQSAFYATPLAVLLRQLGVNDLIITGVAGDGCVLVTAYDAHLREYGVHVPADCIASESSARNRRALQQIRQALHGETAESAELIRQLGREADRAAA